MPPCRYQAVYVDMDQTSYDHAQSICENFGSGLATILDQLDFETLNTTLKGINAHKYCGTRMFLGAQSPENSVWTCRTGESISNDWAYWGPMDPNFNTKACMRMVIFTSAWMEMRDQDCSTADAITSFKCCVCDTLP